ncbi:MAG TPA: SsgA family sporulation/cell division regulator [Nocardioidaceae bacterium]|nr:SsgA family sporulation/cell division regulator [Nocardioidaceae bacterium]
MLDRPGDTSPQAVSHSLTTKLVDAEGTEPLDIELHYDPRSPYAATAVFKTGGARVLWTFGRDLLRVGLYEPVGSGDVHVRPDVDDNGQATVHLELYSPHGAAVVVVPARDVQRFVEVMTATVPPGTESEHLDLDETIDRLLTSMSED